MLGKSVSSTLPYMTSASILTSKGMLLVPALTFFPHGLWPVNSKKKWTLFSPILIGSFFNQTNRIQSLIFMISKEQGSARWLREKNKQKIYICWKKKDPMGDAVIVSVEGANESKIKTRTDIWLGQATRCNTSPSGWNQPSFNDLTPKWFPPLISCNLLSLALLIGVLLRVHCIDYACLVYCEFNSCNYTQEWHMDEEVPNGTRSRSSSWRKYW